MYSKEISFRDYVIVFEYTYNTYPECLGLSKWTAYIGPNEIEIPCVVESEFIETQLVDYLDREFRENGTNYREEYLAYLAEKKYDNAKG